MKSIHSWLICAESQKLAIIVILSYFIMSVATFLCSYDMGAL